MILIIMFGIENDGRLCWNREKKSAQTNEHANNVNNTADIILFIVNIAYIYTEYTPPESEHIETPFLNCHTTEQ